MYDFNDFFTMDTTVYDCLVEQCEFSDVCGSTTFSPIELTVDSMTTPKSLNLLNNVYLGYSYSICIECVVTNGNVF